MKSMRVLPKTSAGYLRLGFLALVMAVLGYGNRVELSFFVTHSPAFYYTLCYSPQEGDIIFQSLPHCDLVDAIEGITHSPYSHCGVVRRNHQNQWVVAEAIFNVHKTPLFLWEFRGRGGEFTVFRLDPKDAGAIPQFKHELISFMGRPYDFNYDMSDERAAYCSGLVYLAFERATGEKLGQVEKLRDLDWKPYESLIKAEQGGGLPLDRVMITPASLARAPQLHEVYRSGF